MQQKLKEKTSVKEQIYFVRGMHCASCELIIEKRLLTVDGIESLEASTPKGQVLIEYRGDKPSAEGLNNIFKEEGYIFSDNKNSENVSVVGKNGLLLTITTALVIIAGFLALNKIGLGGLINVNSSSSLPLLFLLGLLAGISSCAALIGGLILSMSKQWMQIYPKKAPTFKKMQPHIMFNFGRVLSYFLFGAILGAAGNRFQFSSKLTALLIITISVLMVLIALQMLGVKGLKKLRISLPKSATRYVADESNFKAKYMPFFMGAFTLLLPCGFTITVEGLALLSGSPLQGAFIMALFALGTAPALLGIGLSGIILSKNSHLAEKFSKVAGIIIIFFAIFNINSQMNVLGVVSLDDIEIPNGQTADKIDKSNLVPIVGGKQIIKMNASASSYNPSYSKIRVGVPVEWEITASDSLGCNGSIVSNGLFSAPIYLTPGQVTIREFTPNNPGRYKFGCSMGMISGVIEVVDAI